MQIFADLRALEAYPDHLSKELKIVSDLITLLEQQEAAQEGSLDMQRFWAEQLRYMQEEKARIRLRREFMQETFESLQHANEKLKDTLGTASHQLSSLQKC